MTEVQEPKKAILLQMNQDKLVAEAEVQHKQAKLAAPVVEMEEMDLLLQFQPQM